MQMRLSKINYFYILISIIWTPFQKGLLTIDGAARSLFILTILIFILNLNDRLSRRLIISKPISIWGILIIFSAVNLYFKGYYGENSIIEFIILQLLLPFNVLFIVAREIIINEIKTVSLIFKAFLLHLIFSIIAYGTLLLNPSLRQSDSYVNILSLNIIFLLYFSILGYLHKLYKLKTVLLFFSISSFVVILTQTRKAFVALVIFAIFGLLPKFKFTFLRVFGFLLTLIIFAISINFIIENTDIGSRFLEIETVGEAANTSDTEALNFLGDRVYFYIEGWRLFSDNPITGLGLTNFIYQSQLGKTIHSEYMVHLTENGIIGFLIFLIFIINLGKGLYRNIKNNKEETNYYIFLLGGFIGVLLICFTAWIYSFPQYFVLFGVAIGYIKLGDLRKIKKNKNFIQ